MNADMRALLLELLHDEVRQVQNQIREADMLSRPVEPGHWRWADMTTSGYHRKSEAELAEMYERNRVRAAEARQRLELVRSALAQFGLPAGLDQPAVDSGIAQAAPSEAGQWAAVLYAIDQALAARRIGTRGDGLNVVIATVLRDAGLLEGVEAGSA